MLTKPDRVVSVICQMVARFGVCEDGQAVPIEGEPGQDFTEQLGRISHLVASGGVGADRIVVPTAHLDIEAGFDRFAKFSGLRLRPGIVINMRVISCH